jgi:hypothetical protein
VVSCQNERSQHKNRASAMKVLRARLFDLKLKEQQNKLDQIGGEKRDIAFGSQIRSYVLQPYQMVKDHRTKFEVGDPSRVLGGDVDPLIKAYLMQKASGTLGTAADAERVELRVREPAAATERRAGDGKAHGGGAAGEARSAGAVAPPPIGLLGKASAGWCRR